MNRALFAFYLIAFQLTQAASADVFERDWKSLGDGLLTYDNVNQREWLDLSESILDQFPGATQEEKYQNAATELAPGGIFDGFAVAQRADVIDFARSAGIDDTTYYPAVNQIPMVKLIDLIGRTATDEERFFVYWSTGYIDELSDLPNSVRTSAIFYLHPYHGFIFGEAALHFSPTNHVRTHEGAGIMLFREVPEPTSCLLLLSGLYAIGCRSWRNWR